MWVLQGILSSPCLFNNTLNERTPVSGRVPIRQPSKLALPILVGLAAVVSRNRVRVA
jgi:hypothetical protein